MIGIRAIGTHIPADRLHLQDRLVEFGIEADFLAKTGTRAVSRKLPTDETSDLCVKAFADLVARTGIAADAIDCMAVVTQNPDGCGLPHCSAIVHHKLGLRPDAAVFDISLGCSGFVHGLSLLSAFMAANGMARGVLFTADPYSKIVDPADKNTALLFGDAACATLLEDGTGLATASAFTFATAGGQHGALVNNDGVLFMNGRAVFTYAAQAVPALVRRCLDKAELQLADPDLFLFHQGSRYILDTLAKRLDIPAERMPVAMEGYGNTVSSSIPLMLADRLDASDWRRIVLCGFGVGLSAAACVLHRS